MAAESRTTINHDEIRRWVIERGGIPSKVKGTGGNRNTGVLRINFPGFTGDRQLEEITWEEFFDEFEESNLSFLYQDETEAGEQSRFHKFIGREAAEESKSQAL